MVGGDELSPDQHLVMWWGTGLVCPKGYCTLGVFGIGPGVSIHPCSGLMWWGGGLEPNPAAVIGQRAGHTLCRPPACHRGPAVSDLQFPPPSEHQQQSDGGWEHWFPMCHVSHVHCWAARWLVWCCVMIVNLLLYGEHQRWREPKGWKMYGWIKLH